MAGSGSLGASRVIRPIILSGGSGTRLWPLSTPARPKQFLPLIGAETLFQQTLDRVADRSRYGAPIVVANAAHELLCAAELAETPGATLILEPIARNTAVAIVMAAAVALRQDPDAVLLVMPSDHRIGAEAIFHRAVSLGAEAADAGLLVTFGIEPTAPEIGYGYLEASHPHPRHPGVRRVDRFKEKPDLASAEAMLAAGDHYWNGGIFLFRADRFVEECAFLAPEVHQCGIAAVEHAATQGSVVRPALDALQACPDISVDYAVMERSAEIAMVALDADWSDVGSWDALAERAGGNSTAVMVDSSNCFVSSSGPEVALLGVDDLIVIATGERVVIMRRGRSQEIKQLAAASANG